MLKRKESICRVISTSHSDIREPPKYVFSSFVPAEKDRTIFCPLYCQGYIELRRIVTHVVLNWVRDPV